MRVRILAFLTALILITGTIPVWAEPTAEYPTEPFQTLTALGIHHNLAADKTVSRAEFINIIMQVVLAGATVPGGQTPFYDVNKQLSEYDAIVTAQSLDIIKGSSVTVFEPSRAIIMSEAATMLVNALGYEVQAGSRGGYPTGFMIQARLLRLTDGVRAADYEDLNGYQCALMLLNAFDADIAVPFGFGEFQRYGTATGETFLSYYKKIYKDKGVVTGNRITRLDDAAGVRSGAIEIDGKVYNCEVDLNSMLGMSVDFYYRKDDGTNTVVYAAPREGKNTVTEIGAAKVRGVAGRRLEYDNSNGRTVSVNIPYEIALIYNGKARTTYDESVFVFGLGNIVLIDNNGDGFADVVFVNSYKNYLISSINLARGIIAGYYDAGTLDLSEASEKLIELQNTDGNPILPGSLALNTVLTVLESEDGSYIRAVVSAANVRGEAEELDIDEGYIVLGGVRYELDPALKSKVDLKKAGFGVFYLDMFGKVAGYTSAGAEQGLVCVIGFEAGGSKHRIKVLESTGTVNIYDFASKYTVDDKKYTSFGSDTVPPVLSQTPKLAKMTKNSNNEVVRIETDASASSGIRQLGNTAPLVCRNDRKTFGGVHPISGSALIFLHPGTKNEEDVYYSAGNSSIIGDWGTYTVSAYSLDPNVLIPQVFLAAYNSSEAIQPNAENLLIGKITTVMHEGVERHKIVTYSAWGEVVYYTEDTSLVPAMKVKAGDVVKMLGNRAGLIKYISRVYDFDERGYATGPGANFSSDTGWTSQSRLVYGDVAYFDRATGVIGITRPGKSLNNFSYSDLEYFSVNNSNLYVVDGTYPNGNIDVHPGDSGDIMDYTNSGKAARAVVSTNETSLRMIVLYYYD